MTMPKQRLLRDLYNVTRTVSQAKITPVLRGICQMQGPVDEADQDFTYMVATQADKESSSSSKNLKVRRRTEFGTCDVCSAPCSSCLHMNQQLMGSKIDECSGAENALNVCVDNDAPTNKIVKFETEQKSEIRNSVNENLSIPSENGCSGVSVRSSGLSTASQNLAMPNHDETKGKGCNDDTLSCVTGSEDGNNGVRTDLPSNAASDGSSTPVNRKTLSHQTSSPCENMKSNVDQSQNNHSRESKNSEESPEKMPVFTCLQAALPLQNSGMAEAVPESAVGTVLFLNAKGGSSPAPCEKSVVCDPNLEETNMVHSDMDVAAFKVTDNVAGSCHSPGGDGNSLESHTMDKSDDSDMMEHDVKVCDICGDAGREDLLAICCRCSDGAEHTYCMREMLTEVPDGDWLCEECKFDVAIKDQKQERVSGVDGNEKVFSVQAKPEKPDSSLKSEAKGSNTEGKNTSKDSSGLKVSAKRHLEDAEVSSVAKKQHVLDPNVGSTKSSVSNGVVAPSRDSSFKHLVRGKIKSSQQSSFCTIAAESTDSPTSSSRGQTLQGNFIKSNSFNSLNVKPKVKLVDDDIPQKQRSVREPISLNKKEGPARSIGKSVSFKYSNLSRINSGEAKVKMLSSKFAPIQDIKGSKYTKERSLFERKNSFKSERTSVSSPRTPSSSFIAKTDKKLASCGEASLVSSVRNHRGSKPLQADNKSMTFSRSSSFAVRDGSETVSLGEVKRQSSDLSCLGGISSTNGISSSDIKPKPSSPKEDSSSSSCIAERLPCSANEGLPDGLSRLKESTSFCERGKESSIGRSKQSSASGRTLVCQKCSELGHLAPFCTNDCPASPASDASAAKSSREIMEGKDQLKAAIEAAVLRKPGIYRKHRILDQLDDVSVSSLSSETAPQDDLLNSSNRGNASAADEMPENRIFLENSNADSCKQVTVDCAKRSGILHVEASTSRAGDLFQDVSSEGLSRKRDMFSHVPEALSYLLRAFAIPDYEYIWQGDFEVYRNGKTLKFCDGIQAHLSSCVSPKVLQVVNKFPHKVLLNEVARLSTWPRQFQEYGVKEDNIALFFFAKDLSSYERSYKVLLDTMMKNDLALKGNLDDVELMIFPSNQLPEKSQRWNSLFFLWGVFRGRRVDCSQHVRSSQKQIHLAREVPSAIMSLPDNLCSLRPLDKDLSECGDSAAASEVLASGDFPCSSTIVAKEDCQEGDIKPEVILDGSVQTSGEATLRTAGFGKCEEMSKDKESSLEGRHLFHQLDESEADGHRSLREGNISHEMSSSVCQVDLKDRSMLASPPSDAIDQAVNNNRKHQVVGTVERVLKASSACRRQVISGNKADDKSVEEVRTSKRRKVDLCGMYGGINHTSSPINCYMSTIHNVASGSSPVEGNCRFEGFYGTDAHTSEENAERYFFPVSPHAEEIDINKAAQSIPWKLDTSDDDRLHDKAPNLELALGAESKSVTQGIPTFLVGREEKKIIQDHPSHEGTTKGEDDDESASLSLSLSFPFPEEDRQVRSMSATEKQHVNTLLFFGDFRGK